MTEYSKDCLEGRITSCGKVSAKALILEKGQKPDTDEKYILVTKYSCPEMAPAMFGAIGVVTEEGGLLSHLSVVARELKIPCIAGCEAATEYVKNGEYIILDASEGIGKKGAIYKK
jgi:phosphoenolpyruvate synthase/pyruvate phosphate dikinase